VILSPPEASKSTVPAALGRREPHAARVHLRGCDGGDAEVALEAAVDSGGPVQVDNLDAVALDRPELLDALGRPLTTLAARGVRWRLACRSPGGDTRLAAALSGAHEGFRALWLLPLDRDAGDAGPVAGWPGRHRRAPGDDRAPPSRGRPAPPPA
jgi:hypothetical protein